MRNKHFFSDRLKLVICLVSLLPGFAASAAAAEKALVIDKSHTAIIAVDFQENILPMAPMAKERGTVAKVKTLLDAGRMAGLPIIHVGLGFRAGYPEVSPNNKMFSQFKSKKMFLASDKTNVFTPLLVPVKGDFVVKRPRVNAFYHSELGTILSAQGVDTIVLCGVATNWAVEGAARYAADADYRVIVLEDCCASETVEAHDFSIQQILPWIADIHSVDEFVQALR